MQVEGKNPPGKHKLVQVLGLLAERTPKLRSDRKREWARHWI